MRVAGNLWAETISFFNHIYILEYIFTFMRTC